MNKEELLKAIEQKRQAIWPTDTGEMTPATVPNNLEQGWLHALKRMKDLNNSLPSEQPSEDFKEEFNNFCIHGDIRNPNFEGPFGYDDIRKTAIHFAQWQKEQMMKGLCYETKVYRDEEGDGIDTPIESWLALENNEITNLPNIGLKEGDKVKIFIIKADKQCSTE